MLPDLSSPEDVKTLVNAFYANVQQDHTIGYIFTEVIPVNWETHLPKMYSFWETVLLGKASFKGNPMLTHIAINAKEKLTKQHFDQWMVLWELTIDQHFSGEMATNAKQRSRSIKELMYHKVRANETAI